MDGTEEASESKTELALSNDNHDEQSSEVVCTSDGKNSLDEHSQRTDEDTDPVTSTTGANPSDVIVLDSDEDTYTNPEPPKDLISDELIHADMIGDTVFSKHWLFTTLMNLIKAVDKEDNAKEGVESSEHEVDLDETLQDELCKLWDMSMNSAVVTLLMEFKAIDLLTGVIAKSKAPRATNASCKVKIRYAVQLRILEICVGILGNMACSDIGCKAVSSDDRLRSLMFLLLGSPDAMTLVETTRLIYTCLSSDSVYHLWIKSLKENPSVYNSLVFILKSSTNNDLLLHTSELIDKVLDSEDDILIKWSTADMVEGVLEAIKQCSSRKEALDSYLHILQLISTCDPGVEAIGVHSTSICDLTLQYLIQLCTEDILVLEGQENAIGCVLCVLTTAFTALEDKSKLVVNDFQLMRCLLKILSCVYPKVRQLTPDTRKRSRSDSVGEKSGSHPDRRRTCSVSDSVDDGEKPEQASNIDDKSRGDLNQSQSTVGKLDQSTSEQHPAREGDPSHTDSNQKVTATCDMATVEMLYEVIQNILTDVVLVLCEEDEISPSAGDNSDPEKKNTSTSSQSEASEKSGDYVPKTLTYLNELCVRQRLRILVYTLDEVLQDTEVDCCKRLSQMAQKYQLSRLEKIVQDYSSG